jgi:hypothetical protein
LTNQLEFESRLVRRNLDAVGDEPGNLPLLEFVLKELWERRGRVLLNEVYDAIGGHQGAVASKADELFKSLSLAEQKILQRVFMRIVRPPESGLDTRRRAAFTELPPESVDLVVKLANERLLVTNESASGQTVEVAHEALISNWDTLRSWVNEDRKFLLWRERLDGLLREWEGVDKDEGALLRGPLLIEAQKWLDKRSQDLPEEERSFINASRALRERAASKLRRLVWMLALVALLAVVAAVFGLWQKGEAERQARLATEAKQTAEKQTVVARESSSRANVSLARYSHAAGNNAQALAHLAQALRLKPDNYGAASLAGSILTQFSWPLRVADLPQRFKSFCGI